MEEKSLYIQSMNSRKPVFNKGLNFTKSWVVALAFVPNALLAAVTGTTDSWPSHAGTLDGVRYSALSQIDTLNVGNLIEEFSIPTGVNGSHMGAPLVVGSTLYVVTPFPNSLVAYDLSTGAVKWTFAPKIRGYAFGVNCCDTVNRGASYANGLIVFNTLDDTTVAVDAVTGLQKWQTVLADPTTGVTTNGATLIVPDKSRPGQSLVIVGSSSGEMGVRGWVKALDLATGALRWTAYTTGPDADVMITANTKPFYAKDKGKDLGISSWQGAGDKWQQGGSSVWGYFTYDDANDLLFYGTSQPGVWNAEQRPGENKWGASLFARKASTGEAAWIYQVTPHDQWDYDAVSESIPLDLAAPVVTPSGKSTTQVLVHFNKNGFAYTFDRLTGEIISAPVFGPNPASVNWASDINLTTGLPTINPSKLTEPVGTVAQNICPSAMGLKGWEPSAYSPVTNYFYLPLFNLCMNYQGLQTEYVAGAPYMGIDMQIGLGTLPGTATAPYPMGELVAWDFATGQRVWSIAEARPIYGGVLATAGNVVFYTTLDNKFKAVHAANGQKLYETSLECSSVGSPVSFINAIDGKQRIAVFSGVSWLAGGFSLTGKPCPGRGGSAAVNGGGRVHIYKLP